MEYITHKNNTFEVVNFVPMGFMIWNIGKQNAPKGYLPLCRLNPVQPFKGGRAIDTETLKAIKIDGAEKILDAVGGGQYTIKQMEKYIQRYRNAKPETWSAQQVKRMKEALLIMRKIKGL